ncbi:hypothetical protein ACC687_39080, partial [Rhizobium ruizarguesonis]
RAVPGEDVEVMRSILDKMPSLLRRPVGNAINFIAPTNPAGHWTNSSTEVAPQAQRTEASVTLVRLA